MLKKQLIINGILFLLSLSIIFLIREFHSKIQDYSFYYTILDVHYIDNHQRRPYWLLSLVAFINQVEDSYLFLVAGFYLLISLICYRYYNQNLRASITQLLFDDFEQTQLKYFSIYRLFIWLTVIGLLYTAIKVTLPHYLANFTDESVGIFSSRPGSSTFLVFIVLFIMVLLLLDWVFISKRPNDQLKTLHCVIDTPPRNKGFYLSKQILNLSHLLVNLYLLYFIYCLFIQFIDTIGLWLVGGITVAVSDGGYSQLFIYQLLVIYSVLTPSIIYLLVNTVSICYFNQSIAEKILQIKTVKKSGVLVNKKKLIYKQCVFLIYLLLFVMIFGLVIPMNIEGIW